MPARMTTFLHGVEQLRGGLERLGLRHRRWVAATTSDVWPETICSDDVLVRDRPVLDVRRTGQVRDAPARQRRPAGEIDQRAGMLGARGSSGCTARRR